MLYNKVLENFILPAGDAVFQTNFINELKRWRNDISQLNPEDLAALQKQNLATLLKYGVEKIPYYQRLNIELSNNPYNDIKKFPLLTKQILKQNINHLHAGNSKELVAENSSGSSGFQTTVYMSKKERAQAQAAQTYLWEFGGYKPGEKLLQTGISPHRGLIKSLKDIFFRTRYADAYNLSEEKIYYALKKAKSRKYKYFAGFASSLNSFAKVAIARNLEINFSGVMLWGDKLFDEYKRNIEKAFGNPLIVEQYGSAEGFIISGTCVYGRHHILSPHVYIELLDKDGNEVAAGSMGHVVVTRLDAYSFPLIRYTLGDLAIKEDDDIECPCGKHFPLLKKIIGRDTDVVQTPAGKDLIVHFFTGIFEHFQEIEQFCIIQKQKNGIEIQYIPAAKFDVLILDKIEDEIFTKAKENFSIHWVQVNNIPATPSGKPQIIKNFIAEKLT
ncbi:MAG: hypothetical protein ABJA79_03020 [Parafilimonas sp.]